MPRYDPFTRPYRSIPQLRIKGGNMCPPAFSSYGTTWAASWQGYPALKSTWEYPQVDAIASIGGTIVRKIGCVDVVTSGTISRATYLSYWGDFLQYCHAKGLWVYVCASSYPAFNNCTFPNGTSGTGILPEAVPEIAALAGFVKGFPNVWAFDISNEPPGMVGSTQTSLGALAGGTRINGVAITSVYDFLDRCVTAIRAAAPDLPCGSANVAASSADFSSSMTQQIVNRSDFIDLHCYTTIDTTAETNADSLIAANPGKIAFSGEHGTQSASAVDSAFASAYINDQLIMSRTGWHGGIWWDICGQPQWYSGTSQDFGLFVTSGTGDTTTIGAARPLVVAQFQADTAISAPIRFTRKRGG